MAAAGRTGGGGIGGVPVMAIMPQVLGGVMDTDISVLGLDHTVSTTTARALSSKSGNQFCGRAGDETKSYSNVTKQRATAR